MADRQSQIDALGPWFHNLHLPGGTQTAPDHPLGDFPAHRWEKIAPHLPADLTGWSVLDVGCNAGFYSFELAARGAEVLGIDVDPHYLAQARWAAREIGLSEQVRFEQMQIYDLARHDATYDLVWFMGVFYHLRYPLLGLDTVAQKARRLLVFQSLTMPGEAVAPVSRDRKMTERDALREPDWPHLAFIEHEFAGDPTNWWVPNRAAVEALLRSSGLRIRQRPHREIYLCEPAPPDELGPLDWNRAEWLAATGQPWRGATPTVSRIENRE